MMQHKTGKTLMYFLSPDKILGIKRKNPTGVLLFLIGPPPRLPGPCLALLGSASHAQACVAPRPLTHPGAGCALCPPLRCVAFFITNG